jgi:outer membrane protein TolC
MLWWLLIAHLSAEPLSFDKIQSKLIEDFPKIVEQQEKIKSAESKQQKAEGAFDLSLQLKGKSFEDGYYDGQMRKVSIDKPLAFMNSNISVGQKKGVGIIPVYNQEYATDDAGEFFVRFEASLLRYRAIDPSRYDLWLARNQIQIEKLQMALKKQDVFSNANLTYWKWFFYRQKKELYQELVNLNKERMTAVEKRVQKNDLPRIYMDESLQYLYAFEGELELINGELAGIEAKLKIYYDQLNPQHEPINVDFVSEKLKTDFNLDVKQIVDQRPEIQINQLLLQNQDFDINLAQQKILPKLDLAFEHYNAQDKKSPYLDENVVAVSLEIPIERNLGRGDINRAQAEKRMLNAQRDYIQREITSILEQLRARLTADGKIYQFASMESAVGKKLQNAEWVKFRNGASDFFLINTRDMNYAKARLKVLESYVDYQISLFQLQLWKKITE